MPSNKAPGIDKITIRVIKDRLNQVVHAIKSIVNVSFLTCFSIKVENSRGHGNSKRRRPRTDKQQ